MPFLYEFIVMLLVFLSILTITIISEGAVMLLLFRKWKYVYYSLLCNLLTNPALNLILASVYIIFGGAISGCNYIIIGILEIAVVFIEAHVYKLLCGFEHTKALWVSALLNAVSFGAGALIQHLLFPFL
jgi:hypothetical protein